MQQFMYAEIEPSTLGADEDGYYVFVYTIEKSGDTWMPRRLVRQEQVRLHATAVYVATIQMQNYAIT